MEASPSPGRPRRTTQAQAPVGTGGRPAVTIARGSGRTPGARYSLASAGTGLVAGFSVVFCFALASCSTRSRTGPSSPQVPGAAAAELPSSAGVRYKGTIETAGRSVRVRVDLYAAAPDLVRAEISSPLGQPLVSIVLRGEQAVIIWPRERAWWGGTAGGSAQAGLPGGGAAWAAALRGDLGSLRSLSGASETQDGDRIVVALPIEGAAGVRLVYSREPGLPPESIESSPSPDLVIRLTRGSSLPLPDPARSFSLEAPGGFSRWSEFDLPAMIGDTD